MHWAEQLPGGGASSRDRTIGLMLMSLLLKLTTLRPTCGPRWRQFWIRAWRAAWPGPPM